MPTKVPKAGTRRSGQGVAVPHNIPQPDKNWDAPRPLYPTAPSAGGSPSSAADSNASSRMGAFAGKFYSEESYDPDTDGEDVLWPRESDEQQGEAGCTRPGICRSPRGEMVGEQILRRYIKTAFMTEVTAGEAIKTGTHLALDVCGVVADLTGVGAGVGATCDAVNAAGYAVEGEYLFAVLSLISAIPVIGDVIGKGGKVTAWLTKTFPKASEKVAKHGPNLIKQIRELKLAIKANKATIDDFLDRVEENENLKDLHPHMDKMREALDVFLAEGEGERRAKEAIEQSEKQQTETRIWLRSIISETEMIDEDEEEEEEPEIDEFSAVGAIAGYMQTLGSKPPKVGGRKRKRKGYEVRGFKPTHG